MSTFSTRALILGHHETGTQISQPILQIFLKLNSSVHNLIFELCTVQFLYQMYLQLRFKILAHFMSSVLLYWSKNPIFIFRSQNSSQNFRKYVCRPLNNRD